MAAPAFVSKGNTVEELMQELNEIQSAASIKCDYAKTLALLRALKAGTISLDNVTVTADGRALAEVEPPAEPDTEPPEEDE